MNDSQNMRVSKNDMWFVDHCLYWSLLLLDIAVLAMFIAVLEVAGGNVIAVSAAIVAIAVAIATGAVLWVAAQRSKRMLDRTC